MCNVVPADSCMGEHICVDSRVETIHVPLITRWPVLSPKSPSSSTLERDVGRENGMIEPVEPYCDTARPAEAERPVYGRRSGNGGVILARVQVSYFGNQCGTMVGLGSIFCVPLFATPHALRAKPRSSCSRSIQHCYRQGAGSACYRIRNIHETIYAMAHV